VRFWASVAFVDNDQLLDIARACDDSGYHGILVSDHLLFPEKLSSSYPYSPDGSPIWSPSTPWPDPWVLIGAMAAVTTRLHFSTNIYVAPIRNPFVIAKAVATAAVLSRDRVALGLAAGWMREEADLLGVDFDNRGPRLDELIEVLRTLWRGGMVEHHGTFYDFDRLEMSPVPAQPIAIYGGGHSRPALQRAARLDGWIGNAYPPDVATELVGRLHGYRAEADRAGSGPAGHPFETIVGVLSAPDLDLFRRLEDAGVTGLICAPWISARPSADAANRIASFAEKRAAIERFAEEVVHRLG
jgi:probable F420-dependent oxidoreductase